VIVSDPRFHMERLPSAKTQRHYAAQFPASLFAGEEESKPE
jgi:hypothetical protein